MRYVIIGNGVAGITAAFTLRARDASAEILLVSGESDYFFSRCALMYAFMDRMSLRDLEPHERRVYAKQNFRLIRDWVTDLDASRRLLTLQSGSSLAYDRLLLSTGSLGEVPDWPGLNRVREGAVHFVTLQDLGRAESLARSAREAVVVGGGLIGVELVECLVYHRLKVTFHVRAPWYWPGALAREEAEIVSEHIRRHGVDLRMDEEVAEILTTPEGRVCAVRAKSGHEYSCQLLGIAVGVSPQIAWLRGVKTPPRLGRGIQVSSSFETSLENVWAAGDCAEFSANGAPFIEQIWYSARRQGELAARAMLGDTIRYDPPIFYNSAKFFGIEYTATGEISPSLPGVQTFFCHLPAREASVRITERAGAVIGINMLGARWDHSIFERWIAERRDMDYAVAHLPEAQFDVEFGRVDLTPVAAAYHNWRARSAAAK